MLLFEPVDTNIFDYFSFLDYSIEINIYESINLIYIYFDELVHFFFIWNSTISNAEFWLIPIYPFPLNFMCLSE